MNPILSAEIARFAKLRDALRGGPDCHPRTFAEAYVLGLETAAEMLGSSALVPQPVPQPVLQSPRPTIGQVMQTRTVPPNQLLDSGLIDATPVPEGFPPTAALAAQQAASMGIDAVFASGLWTICEQRGWVNTKGRRIINWNLYLSGCWKDQQNRRLRQQAQQAT